MLYPETFLYGEQYALIIYLDKVGLKTARAGTGPIIHKHGASTPDNLHEDKFFKTKMKRTGKKVLIRLMLMPYKKIQSMYS